MDEECRRLLDGLLLLSVAGGFCVPLRIGRQMLSASPDSDVRRDCDALEPLGETDGEVMCSGESPSRWLILAFLRVLLCMCSFRVGCFFLAANAHFAAHHTIAHFATSHMLEQPNHGKQEKHNRKCGVLAREQTRDRARV